MDQDLNVKTKSTKFSEKKINVRAKNIKIRRSINLQILK